MCGGLLGGSCSCIRRGCRRGCRVESRWGARGVSEERRTPSKARGREEGDTRRAEHERVEVSEGEASSQMSNDGCT